MHISDDIHDTRFNKELVSLGVVHVFFCPKLQQLQLLHVRFGILGQINKKNINLFSEKVTHEYII